MSRCLAPGHVKEGACNGSGIVGTDPAHEGRPYPRAMARAARVQIAGGMYHVTARGNRRQPLFEDDCDRDRFIAFLGRTIEGYSWVCHGYCLMDNHYHLVVETPRANLSRGMHRLNSGYAHWFNWRHDFDGHLFQSRFHAVLVESHWHQIELSRYLAINPVAAGLCGTPADWPWGSYRFVAGIGPCPRFLAAERVLTYFGKRPEEARETFRQFVLDGL
jgi:putative transposase